jgi:hypothetical protein
MMRETKTKSEGLTKYQALMAAKNELAQKRFAAKTEKREAQKTARRVFLGIPAVAGPKPPKEVRLSMRASARNAKYGRFD